MNLSLKLVKNTAFLLATVSVAIAACNHETKRDLPTKNRDLPHMWVNDSTSQADEQNFFPFATSLATTISQPETDSIYFPLSGFRQMIEAFGKMPGIEFLDMYPVVRRATGKLDILFAPQNSECNTIGYFQLKEGATSWPQKGDTISDIDAMDWQDIYDTAVVRRLNPKLDSTDPGNYVDGVMKSPLLNTLHIAHYYSDFAELDSEINYQATLPKPNIITGMKAFFAAKPTKPKGNKFEYSNRLYLLFEYTIGNKQVFYISTNQRNIVGADLPAVGACTSSYFIRQKDNVNRKEHLMGNNNGQMCPPACNP